MLSFCLIFTLGKKKKNKDKKNNFLSNSFFLLSILIYLQFLLFHFVPYNTLDYVQQKNKKKKTGNIGQYIKDDIYEFGILCKV